MNYVAIIGLEIHLQLLSESKLFCGAPTTFGKAPNSNVGLIDMAFPGTMPVLNKKCVISAIRMVNALHMELDRLIRFDRKNYFYSDLAKGYQLTQFFHPIGKNGHLAINVDDSIKIIRINHLHIEEDSAKQIHAKDKTLLDFNRAGMGLIEIVTDPDIRNGKEARIFLEDIRDIAMSLGVSNGRLQEGTMRVDVNVSLKVDGVDGEIVELKNLNGFKNVEKAITSEIKRQKEIVSSGKSVKPETRRYDEAKNETVFMRKKNTKIDYRYFADATIAPIRISQELVDEALNYKTNKKFKVDFLLPETIDEINNDPYLFKLFSELKEEGLATLKVSNFVLTRIRSEIKRQGSEKLLEIENDLLSLLRLYDDEEITYKQASILYKQLLESKKNLGSLLEENGFTHGLDNKELSAIIDEILVKYNIAVQDYKAGKDKALNYLLGQIYKETKNKVDSLKIKDMLLMKLEEK